MRAFLAAILSLTVLAATPVHAACTLEVRQALAGSPFFGQVMALKETGVDGSMSFYHPDDPRMIATFTMQAAEPLGEISRAAYVDRLEEYADFKVSAVRKEGRWAEKALFPYDPVGWRMVEETEVKDVGSVLAGHMEIRLTEECLLAADFISPSSPNLRSRWATMTTEIARVRETAAPLVVTHDWLPDDTTPVGVAAIAGGFMSPVGVIGLIYLLLGQLRRLDPPGTPTRVVLASSAAVAAGTVAYQSSAYVAHFAEFRYVDNFLLLSAVAISSLAGALLGQRAASLGLIASFVSGIALSVASALGWTPDVNVSFAVGGSLIVMGGFGFYAWSEASGRPSPGIAARPTPRRMA